MPFQASMQEPKNQYYVKAYTSLNDPANLPKAEKLIEAASGFKNNLKNNLSGLPEIKEVKVIAELAGKGQQNTLCSWIPLRISWTIAHSFQMEKSHRLLTS